MVNLVSLLANLTWCSVAKSEVMFMRRSWLFLYSFSSRDLIMGLLGLVVERGCYLVIMVLKACVRPIPIRACVFGRHALARLPMTRLLRLVFLIVVNYRWVMLVLCARGARQVLVCGVMLIGIEVNILLRVVC